MITITRTIISTATTTIMTTEVDAVWAEAPLLLWLSPAFPVGAYAYSHGIEWAHEAGDVTDARSLAAWLADLAAFGAPRLDAFLFALAHRAASAHDWDKLDEINTLAVALAGSAERRLETTAQGAAFRLAARAAWDSEPLQRVAAREGEPIAYPIAVAAAAAGRGMALARASEAYVVAQFANLVSAATRLAIVGQTDGLKILAQLSPALAALARTATSATLDDLGACAFRSDIAAMRHETQYSRLFRS
jgi:urease accessory protein